MGKTSYLAPRVASLLWVIFAAVTAAAQSTAFTYQGKLADNGSVANGSYDFIFRLYNTGTVGTGSQIGSTISVSGMIVNNGVFTTSLDFGSCPTCFDGNNRFIEVSIHQPGGPFFTTLSPRQPITATPYALKSLASSAADGLTAICSGCVNSSQIADGTIVNADIGAAAAISPSKIAGTAATLGANTYNGTQSLANGNISLPATTNNSTGVLALGGGALYPSLWRRRECVHGH